MAKELPPSLSTPFSKLDVLRVISCYAQVGKASDAITKRGLKGERASRINSEGGACVSWLSDFVSMASTALDICKGLHGAVRATD